MNVTDTFAYCLNNSGHLMATYSRTGKVYLALNYVNIREAESAIGHSNRDFTSPGLTDLQIIDDLDVAWGSRDSGFHTSEYLPVVS